ncbi:hypothetical protein HYH02_002025 [Chlamydomonas schloesseri]|uniref:Uncharacterized protein n=1 Tax=Chlamydomonas schloesseri TaxID=2026947 RepID=A0A836BC22_9CHLO|nr:hypothetical protein HYH02_002025 [Chlamydomonas schloesseri]|eukprot:KAG2453818.1 hypothetical protein HYH02_002025 [Chlamydomonas schloesseri]
MPVFGLTAVDMASAEPVDSPTRLHEPDALSTPSAAAGAHPTASALPDMAGAPTGIYLTEPPSTAGGRAGGRSPRSGSPGKGGAAAAAAAAAKAPLAGSTSKKALAAGTPSSKKLAVDGDRASGGRAPPPPVGRTPPSSAPAPTDPNRDPRNFDGKELHELVRVAHEDYANIPRLQNIITMQLEGRTTEAAKAEALMQIREASVHNPLFTMTPRMLELVREQLCSRNRMLRPAAAYALAGYATNSRAGRGVLTCHAAALLPRLNAMLRCKVDSMDARYASLALLTATMSSENKEAVGRSGSIPLLVGLVRQNLGRHCFNVVQSDGSTFDDMVNLRDPYDNHHPGQSQYGLPNHHQHHGGGGGADSTASGTTVRGAPAASVSGAAPASTNGTAHGGVGGVPLAHLGAGVGGLPHAHLGAGGASGLTSPHDSVANTASGGAAGGAASGGRAGGGGSVANTASGGVGGAGPRAQLPNDTGKGTYCLSVKPAGQHAMAALVNLAELPANRQRMREAGIVQLMEDVMGSRNENSIKERCRLLIDFLQMDTEKFKEAKAALDATATAMAGHAALTFVRGGARVASRRVADAAVAAANIAVTMSESGAHGGGGPDGVSEGGGTPRGALAGGAARGTLAWSLARQLEHGRNHDSEDGQKAGHGGHGGAGGHAGHEGGKGGLGGPSQKGALGRATGTVAAVPRMKSDAAEKKGGPNHTTTTTTTTGVGNATTTTTTTTTVGGPA